LIGCLEAHFEQFSEVYSNKGDLNDMVTNVDDNVLTNQRITIFLFFLKEKDHKF